jgi:diguanylate cyclase (GGDEF)-like protein
MTMLPVTQLLNQKSSHYGLKTKLAVVLAAPILATVLVSVVANWGLRNNIASQRSVVESNQAIALANALVKLAVDAETSVRGYVITGNERFLEPYQQAVASFPQVADQLRGLVQRGGAIDNCLTRIETYFAQWNTEVGAQNIAHRRQAPPLSSAAARSAQLTSRELRRAEATLWLRGGVSTTEWTASLRELKRIIAEAEAASTNPSRSAGWKVIAHKMDLYEEAVAHALKDKTSLAQGAAAAAGKTLQADIDVQSREDLEIEGQLYAFISSGRGRDIMDKVRGEVRELERKQQADLRQQLANSERASRNGHLWMGLSFIFTTLVAGGLAFWLARSISDSARSITQAAQKLEAGDLSQRALVQRNDELGHLARAFNSMAARLENRTRESELLARLGDMLQACLTPAEAAGVVSRIVPQLLPRFSGGIFTLNSSRNWVQAEATWLGASNETFSPQSCWALRSGRVHHALVGGAIVCEHAQCPNEDHLCVPLQSQSESLGILHLASSNGQTISADEVRLAQAVAENIALAMGNLKLREALRDQAIRDPLTGLFNRRYLEETLVREVEWSKRHHRPFGVIFFDIDHFKRFNDTYGHDGGDALLREQGNLVRTFFRKEDIVCRYGGEEFVVVLRDANMEDTLARAEALRKATKQLRLVHQGRPLGLVTISVGVANFPDHGLSGDNVVRAADQALLLAKQSGRDKVCLAELPAQPEAREWDLELPTHRILSPDNSAAPMRSLSSPSTASSTVTAARLVALE